MNQDLIDRCPFRSKSSSLRIYMAIARSSEPMTKSEIARAAHLTVVKTATLLAAYMNSAHKTPLDRVGVRLARTKVGGYTLELCKPKPNAKRPPRGTPKKAVKKKVRRAASDGGNEPPPLVSEVAPPNEPGN